MTDEPTGLPVDPDLYDQPYEPSTHVAAGRPVHLRWRYLFIVGLGGCVGAALREGATLLIPAAAGVPLATLTVNVVGAFLLGFLLQVLVLNGDDSGGRRTARLLLGTGVLGAFTTYSSLSTDTALLLGHAPLLGIAYAIGTVVVGAAATFAGISVASAIDRGRVESTP